MFVEWARRVFAMQTAEELYLAELAKFLTTENYLSKPLLLIAFDHLSITEQQYLMTAYATSGVAYWSEQDEMLICSGFLTLLNRSLNPLIHRE